MIASETGSFSSCSYIFVPSTGKPRSCCDADRLRCLPGDCLSHHERCSPGPRKRKSSGHFAARATSFLRSPSMMQMNLLLVLLILSLFSDPASAATAERRGAIERRTVRGLLVDRSEPPARPDRVVKRQEDVTTSNEDAAQTTFTLIVSTIAPESSASTGVL